MTSGTAAPDSPDNDSADENITSKAVTPAHCERMIRPPGKNHQFSPEPLNQASEPFAATSADPATSLGAQRLSSEANASNNARAD
jgi:hypothetical protein